MFLIKPLIRTLQTMLIMMISMVCMVQPIYALSTYNDQVYDFNTLVSDYIYIYDLTNDRLVYSRNGDEQFYPASLTKMMTLIVGIENIPETNQTMVLTSDIFDGLIEAQASRAGFGINDTVSMIDLFYGIMLPSGAECTRAVAKTVAGSEEAYVDLMNQKAMELGMTNTHFVNTSGLHDENHYSTVHDMAILLEYCLNNELFNTIFTTSNYISSPTESYPNGLPMQSTLSRYCQRLYDGACPSMIAGAKSGFTNPALYCLASYADISGTRYIIISGHAQWEDDANNVTDHINTYLAFENDHYGYQLFYPSGSTILDEKVDDTFGQTTNIVASSDIGYYVPENTTSRIVYDKPLVAPLYQGDQVATLLIENGSTIFYQIPLVVSKDIPVNTIAYWFNQGIQWFNHYYLYLYGGVIIIFVLSLLLLHRRNRRIRRRKRRIQ